ncbi:Calcitonin gene-related peptide type 1 receptor [Fragariocoptes setiger]|uniref:Calcitonin gene-related peptide type 1 receptor n=1 Tax=Fragariocoptes setiger TaxID=1670756 RepID=A0ABQ7SCW8_9ACAR|nr:Calcitonin gene-related peptide type 1 receptor [Fragariocoptes setiger]
MLYNQHEIVILAVVVVIRENAVMSSHELSRATLLVVLTMIIIRILASGHCTVVGATAPPDDNSPTDITESTNTSWTPHHHHHHHHSQQQQQPRNEAVVNSSTAANSSLMALSSHITSGISNNNNGQPQQPPLRCRIETGAYLQLNEYKLETCSRCYNYMPDTSFKHDARLKMVPAMQGYALLVDTVNSRVYLANETNAIGSTFKSMSLRLKWQQCCADAIECCLKTLEATPSDTNNDDNHNDNDDDKNTEDNNSVDDYSNADDKATENRCPRTWDGWSCWHSALAATVTQRECPDHIFLFDEPACNGLASKECTQDAHWFKREGREWSNYGGCAREDIYINRFRYSIFTHLMSIVAIVPALFIFSYYKAWRKSERIRIHKNLLFALLVHAILSAVLKWNMLTGNFDSAASAAAGENTPSSSSASADAASASSSFSTTSASLQTESLLLDNHNSNNRQSDNFCWAISVAIRYARNVCYFWMFNEALYLHLILKMAPKEPQFRPLCQAAYICPFLLVALYTVVRSWLTSTGYMGPWLVRLLLSSSSTSSSINSTSDTLASATSIMTATTTMTSSSTTSSNLSDISAGNDQFESTATELKYIDENRCWLLPSPAHEWIEWIINFPNLCLLLANCVFLGYLLQTMCSLQRLPIASQATIHTSNPPTTPTFNANNAKPKAARYKKKLKLKHKQQLINNNHLEKQRLANANAANINDIGSDSDAHNCCRMSAQDPYQQQQQQQQCKNHHSFGNERTLSTSVTYTEPTTTTTTPTANTATPSVSLSRAPKVLRSKATSSSSWSSSSGVGFGGALKAACLLLPLYGLHYLIIVIRPNIDVDGFQGFAVAVLFCYATKEVRIQLARTFRRNNSAMQRNATYNMTELCIT